ncbi:MAG: RNA 2',3'-cyclic phosphodiesterase [Nanoarchaeota archaeon]
METEDKIRTFICIDFPEEVVKEVARIQELLQKTKFTGKTTELENLHLTLKFLGEVSTEKLEKIKEKLSQIKFNKFEAHLSEIGLFSYRKNPRIVWIKVSGKSVFELQSLIDSSLKEDLEKEERFMSHLTIARIKYVKDKINFEKHVKTIKVKPLKFSLSSFKLKSSELKTLGPVYETIEEYILSRP